MTQTTRTHSLESHPFDELTGPFSDRGAQAAVGDRFADPAWDEHSVPAAQVD